MEDNCLFKFLVSVSVLLIFTIGAFLVITQESQDVDAIERNKPIEPVQTTAYNLQEQIIEIEEEPEKILFRVTAYCSCKKCCGKWADNRPVDENGNQIVCGASGAVLESRFSCASPLEFGTQIELNGIGLVEVQDRTSNWIVNKYGNNVIDIYMDDHEKAKIFGVRYVEGVIK